MPVNVKIIEPNCEILLNSLTKKKITEIIEKYNKGCYSGIIGKPPRPIKGYKRKKRRELITFLSEYWEKDERKAIAESEFPNLLEELVDGASKLILGIHKTEKILNTLSFGKTYNVWFKGLEWIHKAGVDPDKPELIKSSCNCRYGGNGGICIHETAIYMLLFGLKRLDFIPLPLNDRLLRKIRRIMEFYIHFKVLNIHPAIVLEGDYNVFIFGNMVMLNWGGEFPGRIFIDFEEKYYGDPRYNELTSEIIGKMAARDKDAFLTDRISALIIRKVSDTGGRIYKILVDNYGIIDKILDSEKAVNRILNRLRKSNNPNYPRSPSELKEFLTRGLHENIEETKLEPPFPAYLGNEPYVFVSYTHRDKFTVYPIIAELRKKGIKIWYDEGIPLSEDWKKVIMDRLMNCSVVLSFISHHVLESDMTKEEIFTALGEEKRIIFVFLEKTRLSGSLKLIRNVQGLERYNMSTERFNRKLSETLQNMLGT